MNNNFKKSVADIRLTQEEKALGKQKLLKFMQANPVRISNSIRHQSWSTLVRSNFNFLTKNFMKAFLVKPIGAVLGLLIVGGIGTSFAAQGSMPGDVLYPVKIHFNEKVAEMVQFSTKAKAEIASAQAQTRLEEAEKLAEQGKLNSDIQTELTANFNEKVAKTKGLFKKQKAENDQAGAKEVRGKFNSSLKAHQKVLENLAANGRGDSQASEVINGLITNVKSSIDNENEQDDLGANKQEDAQEGTQESNDEAQETNQTTQPKVSVPSTSTSAEIKTEDQAGLETKDGTELNVETEDDVRVGL
ncbi:MAG: DUF5667 domain-containing protein [Candidatus Gracilibacteria bacterium]|jgi:hypothetical protein